MRIERRKLAVWGALAGLCVFLLSGCQSSDVDSSLNVGSLVAAADSTVLVVPAATVAIAADRTGVAVQESLIAVGAPEQLYSEQVTKSDLWRMNMQHGCKFYEPWKYMGTRGGEHYLAIYPFLGFREVYSIAADEYLIEESFELTARTSTWRDINKFSHHGIEQLFIIEPLLFEQAEALVPVQFDAIPVNDLGGDVEDLLMQDVQILELE
tara:strand:- start:3836 stop:4465 length:630 start_codon:yes stop_codon:yes gene_type:complete